MSAFPSPHIVTRSEERVADRAVRILMTARRVLKSEPTAWIEAGTVYFALVWAVCLALPGPLWDKAPLSLATMAQAGEAFWCLWACAVVLSGVLALWYDGDSWHEVTWRDVTSILAALFYGAIAGSLAAQSWQLPGVWTNAGIGIAALIPYWRRFLPVD